MTALDRVSLGDFFTLANGALGFIAIVYIFDGSYLSATSLLLLSMVMDGLDGFMARRYGSKHSRGQVLDSISDAERSAAGGSGRYRLDRHVVVGRDRDDVDLRPRATRPAGRPADGGGARGAAVDGEQDAGRPHDDSLPRADAAIQGRWSRSSSTGPRALGPARARDESRRTD